MGGTWHHDELVRDPALRKTSPEVVAPYSVSVEFTINEKHRGGMLADKRGRVLSPSYELSLLCKVSLS